VVQGLYYLHSSNIVHRDLRGANILIKQDLSAGLTDFGLSSFSNATSITSNRAGSLFWMAPELIDPDCFGYRDIYTFGCVCLELYTGRPPFSKLSEVAALLKILNGKGAERPSGCPAMSDVHWQHITVYWAENPASRPTAEVVVWDMVQANKLVCKLGACFGVGVTSVDILCRIPIALGV
ncbi:kinase-like domain-containing protein, partial [Mycena crocata]